MKKYISLIICICILGSCLGVSAAWDGYIESAEDKARLTIVDMNNVNTILKSGAIPDSSIRKDAQYSAHWTDTVVNTTLDFSEGIPRDWSDYGKVEMWIYNKRIVDTGLMFVVYCDKETASGISTKQSRIDLNWTGWKKVKLSFNDMATSRGASLSKVNYIQLWSYGWSVDSASPDTDVYISSISLARESVSDMFADSVSERRDELIDGNIAVYDGSKNIYLSSQIESMAYPAEQRDGKMFIPAELTEKLNAKLRKDGDGLKITFNETVLSLKAESRSYSLNSAEGSFEAVPYEKNGTLYIPLSEVAELFGLPYSEYGRMAVFGGEGASKIGADRELCELISCELAYESIDTSALTKEDYDLAKSKWRYQLVSDDKLDIKDARVSAKLKSLDSIARQYQNSYNRDKDRANLWGDSIPKASSDISNNYLNLMQMALAYGTYGCELYKDKTLGDTIIDGLEWMYHNMYGSNVTSGTGFLNGNGGNWYDWEIGAPKSLVNILVIMEDDLSTEQIKKYLSPVDVKSYMPSDTGANKMEIGYCAIGSALLQGDSTRVIKARDSLDNVYQYAEDNVSDTSGQGFYRDGSYIFHTKHPMNGAYGINMLEAYSAVVTMLDGTVFEIKSPFKDNYAEWIYNSFDPLMHSGGVMSMVTGRTLRMNTAEAQRQINVISQMLKLLPTQRDEDRAKMESLIKYYVLRDSSKDYYSSLSVNEIMLLQAIMLDSTIEAREPREEAKVYPNMDRLVQHRDNMGYSVGLAMSSSRIYNYESITGYNTTGWYLGDGMLYVYNENDPRQFDLGYWRGVNPYRMPGVTADTQEREAASIAQTNEYLSHKDFVGGLDMDGGFAAAAMSLESYHCDGSWGTNTYYAYPATNTGNAPIHDSSLTAKKSWFFFDDEIVCLGADIDSKNGVNVETTIENRKSANTILINENKSATKYEIKSIEASSEPEAENIAANMVDGDLNTRWAAEGPSYVVADLGETKDIGYIALAFYNGVGRQTEFDISVSDDKKTWTKVYTGKSRGDTDKLELIPIENASGRYVKYTGYKNTKSLWVSVSEMQLYSPSPSAEFSLDDIRNIGTEKLSADGVDWSIEYENSYRPDTSWLHLEGTGGYWFPNKINLYARKTNTSPSFTEVWTDHGKDPKGASYEYVLLPNKSKAETAAYSKNPDIRIISNTDKVQAAEDIKNKVTGYVFWSKAKCEDIEVSAPMILMIREDVESLSLSVSDPTQKLGKEAISLDLKGFSLKRADEGISLNNEKIEIDFTAKKGTALKAEFIK